MIAEPLRPLAVPCSELLLDPANARRHPEANIEALKGCLRAYGQRKPIVVNRRTGIIEAGNGTLQAALELGWTHLAVVYVDDDPMTATGFSIADNRTAELAEWDRAALEKLLAEIKTNDPLLDRMLANLSASLGQVIPGQTDPDDVPAPPDEPQTCPGDLWLLGEHRLLCGDAGKAEDVDRLLGGSSIHLVHADPPYNVRVEPRSNNAIAAGLSSFTGATHHQSMDVARHPNKAKAAGKKLRAKDRPLANDFVSDEAFAALLRAWFGNLARVLEAGRSFFIWGGYANLGNYPPALEECGLYYSQGIVWDKEHAVLTRKDFLGAFELAFYGWKKGAAHLFFGPNNVTDLWHVKKVSPTRMVHLTEKPVELAVRAMQYSSRPGENVLDLFGGSGSTLIAAEQTGRRAFLLEIDRLYCDVVVRRWENFTGGKAQRQAAAGC
ncbi:MAG TPA: DNA modification methylase [Gemmataceae bacterium]|nr:DNA modification methylase [Gemmataceae bacterium]